MAPTKLQMIHPSAQEQRENSGGGSQWPSSWRTGTWPPHWRGQCAPCNANVLLRQRLDSSTWLYARHAATVFGIAMISNIVKDMRQGALWHMWQNRKCPPMETLSWKILHVSLYLPFSCPVCICENWGAFNRFANSHKPQKHWQQSEKKTSLVLIPGSIHFLDPIYSMVHWSHCYHIPELHWILQSKRQTEGSVPSASQIKWPREPWAAPGPRLKGSWWVLCFVDVPRFKQNFWSLSIPTGAKLLCLARAARPQSQASQKYEATFRFPC